MASRWGDGDDAKDATATELIIPTTSNYISHESVLVDTPDHEDHFFRCVRYMYMYVCSSTVFLATAVPRLRAALCSSLCLLAMPPRCLAVLPLSRIR